MVFLILTLILALLGMLAHSLPRSSDSTPPFELVPHELLDLIISYLANDKATLLSCALVHTTWTRISRSHLSPHALTVSSPYRTQEFMKLLRSSRETFSSITGITLVRIGDVPAHSYDELLHALKAKGTVLRSGAVKHDPSLVGLFAQYFPKLTAFKVSCSCEFLTFESSTSFERITSFMRALSGSFPRIVELDIELVSGGSDVPNMALAGLRDVRLVVPCLRTLRLVGWNNELVRWLGDNVVGTLERLELESLSRLLRWGEANALIQRNKETLRDLKLIFVKRDVTFDLSHLTRLENLEVARERNSVESLSGWRLPACLKRLRIRNVVQPATVFTTTCANVRNPGIDRVPIGEGILYRALEWQSICAA